MSTQTGAATVAADTTTYDEIAAVITNWRVAEDYALTITIQPHTEVGRALMFACLKGLGS